MKFLFSILFAAASAARPLASELTPLYTHEQYVLDFSKTYASPEHRASAKHRFDIELARVMKHNAGDHPYKLGVNQFSDEESPRPPKGYIHSRPSGDLVAVSRADLPFEVEDAKELPLSVDWRSKGVLTPVKNQGGCGSCWAFGATTTTEAHVAKSTGILFDLAPQMLVSCMENPDKCGGTGGCLGATPELAFDFFAKQGILEEWQLGYSSYFGDSGECTLNLTTMLEHEVQRKLSGGPVSPTSVPGAVAKLDGYVKLPPNDPDALLNAVAKIGPIAISVDAGGWHAYESGVFVQPNDNYTSITINHVVVLVGYGTEQESGMDYWIVQNSWSPKWGENGFIRLKRNAPENLSKACGMDYAPCDGSGCAADCDTPVKVCGTSGILYDTSYPTGASLV